jgi:hypothetical protein
MCERKLLHNVMIEMNYIKTLFFFYYLFLSSCKSLSRGDQRHMNKNIYSLSLIESRIDRAIERLDSKVCNAVQDPKKIDDLDHLAAFRC